MSDSERGDALFVLPEHCMDPRCGVPLAGSWTRHTPECSFGKLIRDFGKERNDEPHSR